MLRLKRHFLSLLAILLVSQGCKKEKEDWVNEYAANKEVAEYMKHFQGRGAVTDPNSFPSSPEDALTLFKPAFDLEISLVLAEPEIVQPVELNFDHKGRLWVVQYNQYPYPKGLKVTSIDNHTRVTFDKTPDAPPSGVQGADKITFFEDTNGDGVFDKSTDAITGLNIATSVLVGRGKIWVLTPPYLLSYPDSNDDGIPDADPTVHASGFGLEDTHAIANSLTWGPDGWLYGVQGSTTTSNIQTKQSKDVRFLGQAVWRFHPESETFELFAEGGGNNPFNLEFDSKGRIFSGSNGSDRGPYYKQGGYYVKSWGKHGPLTNPYAFGYLPNMPLEGEKKRFTHGMIRYEAGLLPERYRGKLLALNPLHNYVQLTRLESWGSSFQVVDEDISLVSSDKWFRPIDIKTGPDGAVYLTDWYDSRLTHVDPRDTWHKSSGRIYRLSPKGDSHGYRTGDLSLLTTKELIALLSHDNKWYRQQAQRIFGDRKDREAILPLQNLLKTSEGQLALEALWALHSSGGLTDEQALEALSHTDPYVRMWTVRLLGDRMHVADGIASKIAELAASEKQLEVLSQLASTAKRLPAPHAIPIIQKLVVREDLENDPDLPLQIWWATESIAGKDRDGLLTLFREKSSWKQPLVATALVGRLAQRWTMSGEPLDLEACEKLLELAGNNALEALVVNGIMEGLRGNTALHLPDKLQASIDLIYRNTGNAPLTLAIRQGNKTAITEALGIMENQEAPLPLRLNYITLMGEVDASEAVPILLRLIQKDPSSAIKQAALQASEAYNEPIIGTTLAELYPAIRADAYVREAAIHLFSVRDKWAKDFLKEIEETRTIHATDVPGLLARKFLLLNDEEVTQKVAKLWPKSMPWTSDKKTTEIRRMSGILANSNGDASAGKLVYRNTCLSCHRLNAEGGLLGPDLSGYDLSNKEYLLLHVVDPNADIREGYETYQFQTTDGRILEGRITKQEGNTIYLQPTHGGKVIILPENKVQSSNIMQWSSMPEGLLQELSTQEIQDLVAYLSE
ncbi:MAG: c-type cytochrome [Lunatimonas sp.]|nr:c-type cytochrome [Lunatimonas sp.]